MWKASFSTPPRPERVLAVASDAEDQTARLLLIAGLVWLALALAVVASRPNDAGASESLIGPESATWSQFTA